MIKKIYVEGYIAIYTPFFKCVNSGALYNSPPHGAEIVRPPIIDGIPILNITEESAPSIFNEYYAKNGFSTLYHIANFFCYKLDGSLSDLKARLNDIRQLVNGAYVNNQTLLRLAFVGAISALDTWVSEVILFQVTKNRDLFIKIIESFPNTLKNKLYPQLIKMWCDNESGSAEMKVIDHILESSYSNFKAIQEVIKLLYDIYIPNNPLISSYLIERHLIVHRSGRKKDGSIIEFSKEELLNRINTIEKFINDLNTQLLQSAIQV